MEKLINLQITMLVLILLGVLLRKRGIVKDEGQKNLMDMLIYLILPSNILSSFLGSVTPEVIRASAMVLVVSIIVQIATFIYGKIIYRHHEKDEAASLRFGLICSNGGYLGNPIAESLFGLTGLLYASIFVIPVRVMMFTQGLTIYTGETDIKVATKKTITHPCILAVIIGLVVMMAKIPIPEMIVMPIQSLSRCTMAVSMLLIGMILSDVDLRTMVNPSIVYYTINRLVIIPGVVYLLCSLLKLDSLVINVCVVLTAMPAGTMTSILAIKYDRAPEFATKIVLFSTICSIPALFIWMTIL